jgi:hypothetical protein
METSSRLLGAEHPDTLASMNNFALTMKEQGRNIEAIELMIECVQLRTLRHSEDVSFPDSMTSRSSSSANKAPSSFFYETQISCAVAGSDERCWVAYCFVDTYFDTIEEGKESQLTQGYRTDPLTCGTVAADPPIRDPRAYFLRVFRVRIDQVRREQCFQ